MGAPLALIGNVAVVGEIDGSDLLRINFEGTPEQAVEATLGPETCRVVDYEDTGTPSARSAARCSPRTT